MTIDRLKQDDASKLAAWRPMGRVAIAALLSTLVANAAGAQSATFGGPETSGGAGQHSGRHGGERQGHAAAAPNVDAPKPVALPTQRLDAGALWCKTEDALTQHQAAIVERLNGGEGIEPGGCHVVPSMTAVSVIERHGPARTEVQSVDQVGWTDSLVRNP